MTAVYGVHGGPEHRLRLSPKLLLRQCPLIDFEGREPPPHSPTGWSGYGPVCVDQRKTVMYEKYIIFFYVLITWMVFEKHAPP